MYPRRQPGYGNSRHGGPPTILLLLVVGALVFGAFFLLQGLRNFTASGGQDSAQATQESAASLTEIAAVDADRFATQTARPTPTPIPPCQDFTIRAPMANLRAAPNIDAEALDRLPEGTEICVIQPAAPGEEWHLIDRNPNTRRVEPGYMHISVLRALRPTPRPTASATPITLATITPQP